MSLFDSGKSALKAGSTKMLVNSLVGVKAKPGWLIVVSGHTDNTGNPKLNQTLSLKRAEAVRDWMRDTGDVPEKRPAPPLQALHWRYAFFSSNRSSGREPTLRKCPQSHCPPKIIGG